MRPPCRSEGFARLIGRLHAAIEHLHRMPHPVVGCVHGAVAGFGLSLMNACDLVVAADSAYFASAYRQIALTPDGGGSWSLPRLVGMRKAMEIFLLGERFGAAEALALGIVNRVVPGGRARRRDPRRRRCAGDGTRVGAPQREAAGARIARDARSRSSSMPRPSASRPARGRRISSRASPRSSRNGRRRSGQMMSPHAHFVRLRRIPLRGTSLRLGVRCPPRGRTAPLGRPGGRWSKSR